MVSSCDLRVIGRLLHPENNRNPGFVVRSLSCNAIQELHWNGGNRHLCWGCELRYEEEHVSELTDLLAISCGALGTRKNQEDSIWGERRERRLPGEPTWMYLGSLARYCRGAWGDREQENFNRAL